MAYAPGVSDRSGEILAGGILQMSQQLAAQREAAKKREEENRLLQSQSKALETLLPVYAKSAGMAPEMVEQFLQASPDESPRARATRLSSAIEGIVGNAALKSKAQQDEVMRQQAAAHLEAIETQKLQREMMRRGQQEEDAVQKRVDALLSQSKSSGVLSPEVQRTVDQIANSPIGTMRQLGVRVSPQMIEQALRPTAPVPGSRGYRTIEMPGVGQMVIDVATNQPVDGGKLIKPQDKKNDEKALTATEIQQFQAIQQAARDITKLEKAFESYQDPNWGGPVAGRVKAVAGMGTNPRIAEIENMIDASTPNLARGVFREVGVLTDTDIKRIKQQLPSPYDTAEIRAMRVRQLKERLDETLNDTLSTLQAAGRDVTGLREKIIGDQRNSGRKSKVPDGSSNLETYRHTDGKDYPIQTIRGQRGVVIGTKFYPIQQ